MKLDTAKLIATGGGLGALPAPGTVTSAVMFLFWFFVGSRLSPEPEVIIYLTLALLILWATIRYCRQKNYQDDGEIVGDELLASLLIIGTLPPVWYHYVLAFVFFRLLDIFKPFGIRRLELIPGTWGIILDDLAAAAVTIVLTSFIPIM